MRRAFIIFFLSHISNFLAGVAVDLGTKTETATGVVTGTESAIENGSRKISQTGKVRECLEDTEIIPEAGTETRSVHGNGIGTENENERGNEKRIGTEIENGTDTEITETEIDTADLVSHPSTFYFF